jgi:tubulin gamma
MNYDKIRKKGAFLDMYRKEPMFRDDLDEFDSSRCALQRLEHIAVFANLGSSVAREVVQSLIDEYKAAETSEYVHWGSEPLSEYEDMRTALGSQAGAHSTEAA